MEKLHKKLVDGSRGDYSSAIFVGKTAKFIEILLNNKQN
ncbi:hypothetical protein V518_1961 [Thermoanaerobacterium aotearoense SCUT27]|uniref:Uncharacterized protein n=2 Tax=Thermoanaerobacterium TaxID=28895 RepID=W9E829_9THEO|nr:hypothetical protein Tsac_0674 [Thermoanaerobacterium saccharolyticum JW/SL-YS485]ETO37888.1 hypothetical protein V518_1961 [Thermoanaerobacterium aotearoense SCUT27]